MRRNKINRISRTWRLRHPRLSPKKWPPAQKKMKRLLLALMTLLAGCGTGSPAPRSPQPNKCVLPPWPADPTGDTSETCTEGYVCINAELARTLLFYYDRTQRMKTILEGCPYVRFE